MSGKKYVEAEAGDKLEVPVEFDEGINKLLAKLEIKRKARIAEHKTLLCKMEKEKVEEKKEERIVQRTEIVGESTDKLSAATDNILQRQKRFLQEMEGQEPSTSTSTPPQILPKNESKEKVDLLEKSSEEATSFSTLVSQLSEDQRKTEKRTKINISSDKKKNINGSFKASIDALFEKTASSVDDVEIESVDLRIRENSAETKLNIDSQRIPEMFDNPCNLDTKQVNIASSNEILDTIITRPIEVDDKGKDDTTKHNHSKLADKRSLTTLVPDGDSINSREKQKIQIYLQSGEIEKKSDMQPKVLIQYS